MDHVWKQSDGYIALGHLVSEDGRAEAPMVWRSPDGRRWHRQPPAGPAPLEAWDAVQTPHGIVTVTGRQAWRSPDGVAWERTEVLGDPNVSVTGTGQLFLTGDAALAIFDTSTPKRQSLEVYWSNGGRHWELLPDAFGPPTTRLIYVSSIRKLRHAIVAVGWYDRQPTVWESYNGRQWQRTVLADPAFHDASVSDITDFGGRIVLVGGIALPGGNKPRAQPLAWLRTGPQNSKLRTAEGANTTPARQ
jgi:hypothetical protein